MGFSSRLLAAPLRLIPLFLLTILIAEFPAPAQTGAGSESKATLVMEFGLDALERRYYRPVFRFDFPARWGDLFSEVQYHSRLNGRLQGAIDYWVNVGVQKRIHEKLRLELRLNHFCRHETLRDTAYIWNMNEMLGRAEVGNERFSLALGLGKFIGGSAGYQGLAVLGGNWRGIIIPELSLSAEMKLVNFERIYHECTLYLALNSALDLFIRNVRHYEFPQMSYFGLRYRSGVNHDVLLHSMKVQVGALPLDEVFKTEVSGGFKFDFFADSSKRVVAAVDFEAPILKGDGFFAQFWPGKMIYDIALDYERKIGAGLYAAWTTHYRLDLPVDDSRPFTASLFTGLALRNQADFDVLEKEFRYELAAGVDFKAGLELNGRIGMGIWKSSSMEIFAEIRTRADSARIGLDSRISGSFGKQVQFRPFIGWKKEIAFDPARDVPGKFLIGLGFFKKF